MYFGETAVYDFDVLSATQLLVTSPAHAADTVDITVLTYAGTSLVSNDDRFTYSAPSAPTVTALDVSSGTTAGGQVVQITGTNLLAASEVLFGTTPADSFTILSSSLIVATAPPLATGTVHVTATTPGGTSATSSADQFTVSAASSPSVTALSQTSGSAAGWDTIVVTGSHFLGTTAVKFGGADALWFRVLSDTSLAAGVPAQAAGTVHVTVSTFAGTSSTSSADQYTYTAVSAPTVTGLSASSGSASGGDVITITGTGFTTASEVTIGGDWVWDWWVNSDTQLTLVTDPHQAGTWDLVVTNAGGDSARTSASRFTFNAADAPAISSVSPSSGTSAGGAVVTITGTDFTAATQVLFGSDPAASFVIVSDTEITAISPPQSAATVDIRVVGPGGTSAVTTDDHFTVTAASAPTVTALSASSGPALGGTALRITGTNFTGATAVKFGTTAASFQVISPTEIIAWSPAHTPDTVDVIVTTYAGTSSTSSADEFTYDALSGSVTTTLSPTSGPKAGGTTVLITGEHFTGATDVKFGSLSAPSFTVLSDTALLAVTPFQAAGTVSVTVETWGGDITLSQTFTFNGSSTPAVTGLSRSGGVTGGGQTVTITGTDFAGATDVKFGATSASFTVLDDSTIRAVTPAGSTGTVHVTVTTADGTSSTTSADQFTYATGALPVPTSLGTSSGSTAGGTSVVITGTGFTAATAVYFDGVPAASFTIDSSTQITATTAPHAAGSAVVTVESADGVGASSVSFTFTAASAPTVTSLGTTTGTSAGGTSVVITGTNLLGTIAVTFGGVPAAFTIDSATQITATSPSHLAGAVDVLVSTYAGTSAPAAGVQFTYTAASAPTVTGLGTSTGSTAGGTSVVITGTNFTGATRVRFGGVAAPMFTVDSSTQITVSSPPQAASTVDVVVETPSGTSLVNEDDEFSYTAASAPTVTALDVTSGTTGGGTAVTLTGTHFTAATAVLFDTTPAAWFTVVSATEIEAVAPPHAPGTVNVTVTTDGGTSSTGSGNEYTYNAASAPAVTSVTPATGSTAGGASIAILGTDFTGASAVTFDNTPALSFTVVSDTVITAVVPSGAAGVVHVRVTTPTGTSATGSGNEFTYTAAGVPTVTGLSSSTSSTAGGDRLTITGTHFRDAYAVTFGSLSADFTVLSDTSIVVTVPSQSAGVVDVRVAAVSGTSAPVSAGRFTYTAASAPTVTGLGTSTGSTAGGTRVVITGTNLTAATGVLFGGVPASFQVDSATQITAFAPSQAAGTVDVRVSTAAGVSAVSGDDEFTYTAASAPTVTELSLTGGSTAGGTVVTITGTNLTAATAVNFGTVAASFQVKSATTIMAVAPSQAAGTVHVTVTTAGGTSSTSSSDQFTYSAPSAPSVSAISPSSGGATGGTRVVVTGSHFTSATGVKFGTEDATDFTVLSDSALLVTAPAGTAGTVHLTVTTAAGTSATSSADQFTYSGVSAPAVSSLDVSTGSTAGGTVVTITGTNFTGATSVSFGSAPANFVLTSATTIVAVAPSQAASGVVDVRVTTAPGTSAAGSGDEFTYTAASAPSISGVTPNGGGSGGGTVVQIAGSNFTAATAVKFGSLDATSFQVISGSRILATAPAQGAGTVDVRVTTAGGTSSVVSADHFTYSAASAPTVTGVGPNGGGTTGGTLVSITGTDLAGATAVKFGTTDATSFTILSPTWIVAEAPAHASGTVHITVTTSSGTSSTSSADQFTYSAVSPTVSAISPSAGPTAGGTSVAIVGTNFTGATAVKFGTTDATSFTVYSPTFLVATAPSGSLGSVHVTVTTPGGTSSTSSADQFTYAAAPSVTMLGTSSGPAAGGTSVTINGSNFTGATAVYFGTTAASFTVNSNYSITATSPVGSAGTVHVTVVTPGGTSPTNSTDQFTYVAAPIVTGVSPSGGTTLGTTSVTITGTNFTGATAVYFGTSSAAFSVTSSTTIMTTAPMHAAGTVDVTVVTPGGTSGTSSADQFTYYATPAVTGISPSSGSTAGGTSVTITGTDFTGATAVSFGGTSASFTVVSSTSITATSPAHTSGMVDVTVTTPGGTSMTSSADEYTYYAPQFLAAGNGPSGAPTPSVPLTTEALAPIVAEAVARWTASGTPGTSALTVPGAFRFEVADLPAGLLGMTVGDLVRISATAAGAGWFIDPTPAQDEEFLPGGYARELTASTNGPAAGRVDLLTVVEHELGNVLGLPLSQGHDVMGVALPAGTRRLLGGQAHRDGGMTVAVGALSSTEAEAAPVEWVPPSASSVRQAWRQRARELAGANGLGPWWERFLLRTMLRRRQRQRGR